MPLTRVLIVPSLALSTATTAVAQTLPFHTSSGITAGFEENAARLSGSLLSRGDLEGAEIIIDGERDLDVLSVVGAAIPFSVTPLWTTRVVVPYLHKSLEVQGLEVPSLRYETSGIGDVRLDTKWIVFSSNRLQAATRFGLRGGIKIPVGATDAKLPDGERAPRRLQVGTGSWDFPLELVATHTDRRWGVHANLGYRFNTEAGGFEGGDRFSYDLAVGFRFVPWFYESLQDQTVVAYLELNGEIAREDAVDGVEDSNSGGHVLFLSPDLQWIPLPWLLFEGSVQVPVVQDLNGVQSEHEIRFHVGSRLRFSVFR